MPISCPAKTSLGGHETHVLPLGLPLRGSVCHQVECQSANLGVASAGSSGPGSGYPLPSVAGPLGLHLSTSLAPWQGSDLAAPIQCSASPGSSLVPGPVEVSINQPRRLLVTETLLRQPWSYRFLQNPGRLQLYAWRLSGDPSVRLDSPVDRIAAPQASSTKSVYDGKWRIFWAWCDGWETDLFTSSMPLIEEFLTRSSSQTKSFPQAPWRATKLPLPAPSSTWVSRMWAMILPSPLYDRGKEHSAQ